MYIVILVESAELKAQLEKYQKSAVPIEIRVVEPPKQADMVGFDTDSDEDEEEDEEADDSD